MEENDVQALPISQNIIKNWILMESVVFQSIMKTAEKQLIPWKLNFFPINSRMGNVKYTIDASNLVFCSI
jgi:hypothetical protein